MRSLRTYLLLTGAALSLRCAHQVGPSGGPPDLTPPAVAASVPKAKSLLVPVRGDIVLTFSEWIEPASAEKSVTIFPPVRDGFRVRVRGRSIRIVPSDHFADSTTYHIEINRTLKDLRGNPIATPFQLIFSTGAVLDSGRVAGCVIDPGERKLQAKVALFRCDESADTVYLADPSYLVQADTTGRFALEHVRGGTYDLLAFNDRNNDNRLQPGEGSVYAPTDKRISLDTLAGQVVLYPVVCDTSTPRITAVSSMGPAILSARWSNRLGLASDVQAGPWRVEPVDSPGVSVAVKSVVPLGRSPRVLLRLGHGLRTTGYRLIYRTRSPRGSLADSIVTDTVRFNAVAVPDTARPTLSFARPAGETDLWPRIQALFSEPVRLQRPAWLLIDSLGDTVPLTVDTSYTDTVVFARERRLQPGRAYELAVPWDAVTDLSGNRAWGKTDTAFMRLRFRTRPQEDLCASLSGAGECLEENPRRIWLLSFLTGDGPYVARDSAGAFRFELIPGGKAMVSAFEDRDGDSAYTPGCLFPWAAPEPLLVFPDTVEARARWDITGIALRACDPCEKKSRQ